MNLFFNSAASDPASALARSQTNNTPAAKPTFVLGDNPEINIYVTDGEGGFDASSGDATVTPSLGIGTPGAGPSGGTFWLGVSTATSGALTTAKRYQIETYVAGDDFANLGAAENASGVVFTSSGTTPTDWTNGSTLIEITTDVSYAASAATLEAALEATEAVVGVTVTKSSAAPNFVVEWDAVGAVALLVGGPSSLTPASAVVTSQLQAGSGSAVEKQVVRLTRQPYALQTVWSTIADGWSARLDCNTRGLLDFLGDAASASSTLELQLTDASSNIRTVGQVLCLIRNEAIDEASTIPTPFPTYLNAAQIGQSFVQNRFQVTALDGGGTALDGIPTGTTANPTVPTDALVAIELSGALSFYQLVSGTDTQSLPDVVRPNDYAASTNERVWMLRENTGGGSSSSTSFETVAFSAAGNTDITPELNTSSHAVIATVTTDGSAFTRTVSLLVENSSAGNRCVLNFEMPESADPLIEVYSNYNSDIAGETWIARESNRFWFAVASSSDGTKLVALEQYGHIYTSTNSGVTWTERATVANWIGVASSNDGTKLLASAEGSELYTSTDSGVTWTARDSNRVWQGVASSSNGTKLVAVVDAGQIYTSTNSGVSWTARDSNRVWRQVASSSNGNKLVATVSGGQIYTSTDSGVTWTARDSNRDWRSIASSSDGTKLVAVEFEGQIYTSTDSGLTWTARDTSRGWFGVASSDDGTKLLASASVDQLYTSTDSGVTWTARESNRAWYGVASSADGTKLVACVWEGQIYTSIGDATLLCTITGEAGGSDLCAEFVFDGAKWQPLSANYID